MRQDAQIADTLDMMRSWMTVQTTEQVKAFGSRRPQSLVTSRLLALIIIDPNPGPSSHSSFSTLGSHRPWSR
eukprot:713689-Rhodomonas_salina.1